MNYLGSITSTPDPPGVSQQRWRELIAAHPNLEAAPPREGINPFTKGPMTYYPDPSTAQVLIDGSKRGLMHWAEDGSNLIVVWGETSAVDDVATQVAAQLGAAYERAPR